MEKSGAKTEDSDTAKWYWSPLYEENIRIPLMIYHPEVKGKRIESLHSYTDLMPTLLDLLDFEIPSGVQGKSMKGEIFGDSSDGRDFLVSSFPLHNPGDITRAVDSMVRRITQFVSSTITTEKWSLLYAAEEEKSELYDLEDDPNQEENVIEENPGVAKELHKNFLELLESSKVEDRLLEVRKKITL